MYHGATALTRMPSSAHSQARFVVSWCSAALVNPYGAPVRTWVAPDTEPTFTIAALACCASCGCASLHSSKAVTRFNSNNLCKSWSVYSSVAFLMLPPALLMSSDNGAPRSAIQSNTASRSSASARSAGNERGWLSGKSSAISSQAACNCVSSRATSSGCAPSAASSRAQARPMPRLAPVISAVCPSSRQRERCAFMLDSLVVATSLTQLARCCRPRETAADPAGGRPHVAIHCHPDFRRRAVRLPRSMLATQSAGAATERCTPAAIRIERGAQLTAGHAGEGPRQSQGRAEDRGSAGGETTRGHRRAVALMRQVACKQAPRQQCHPGQEPPSMAKSSVDGIQNHGRQRPPACRRSMHVAEAIRINFRLARLRVLQQLQFRCGLQDVGRHLRQP